MFIDSHLIPSDAYGSSNPTPLASGQSEILPNYPQLAKRAQIKSRFADTDLARPGSPGGSTSPNYRPAAEQRHDGPNPSPQSFPDPHVISEIKDETLRDIRHKGATKSRKRIARAEERQVSASQMPVSNNQLLANLPTDDEKSAIRRVKAWVKKQENRAQSFDRLLTIAVTERTPGAINKLISMRSRVLGRRYLDDVNGLDLAIAEAVRQQETGLLSKLLDIHPHAGADPADWSAGTLISSFFRGIAAWFGSNATEWQSNHSSRFLATAARSGNKQTIQILLDRGMDLVKDGREIEKALSVAVHSGNAGTTEVLLKLSLDAIPYFADSPLLTTKAAYERNGGVLEVLVSNGMAFPSSENWPGYSQPIHDYLLCEASGRSAGMEKQTGGPLSRFANECLNEELRRMRSRLTPQLHSALNGPHKEQRPAQIKCRRAVLYQHCTIPMVTADAYTAAGFSVETAANLADRLNANAEFYFDEMGQRPLLGLAGAVGERFEEFTREGKAGSDLSDCLMEHGMCGIAAELAGAAVEAAANSASWTSKETEREALLAKALLDALSGRQKRFEEASRASGDPELFTALLESQLKIFENFYGPFSKPTIAKNPGPAAQP